MCFCVASFIHTLLKVRLVDFQIYLRSFDRQSPMLQVPLDTSWNQKVLNSYQKRLKNPLKAYLTATWLLKNYSQILEKYTNTT